MGWTEQIACFYKNGQIDRKEELLHIFNDRGDNSEYKVLKCSMVGTIGYMAVQYTDFIYPERNTTFGLVCLTSVRENRWFGYKDMDETCGPYCYDCPISILKLLSETDNGFALQWREKCWEKHNSDEKNILKRLSMAQENAQIKVTYLCDTNLANKGDEVIFTKTLTSARIHNGKMRQTYTWLTSYPCYKASASFLSKHKVEFL